MPPALPRADNPPVEFPTLGSGYEGARHFLSLFALFEICVARSTCLDENEIRRPAG
jgi:hypothetical protein